MAAYGWTLDQVLDLTLPQARALLGAIGRMPPPSVLAPMLLRAFSERRQGDPADAAQRLAQASGMQIVTGMSPETMALIKGALQ